VLFRAESASDPGGGGLMSQEKPMRRHLSFVAAAIMIVQPALAAPRCAAPADQAMFEVAALKSELMVLAVGCQRGEQYNAFVTRYRPSLVEVDKHLTAYFRRAHGARGQTEADRFGTDLANAQSTHASSLGGDFCPRNSMIFAEVMALPNAADLANFAAGKALIPASLTTCLPPPAPARPSRPSTQRH
jgi:hypothetical protein